MTFSEFSLSRELHASVLRMGFEQPTPIQEASIPRGTPGGVTRWEAPRPEAARPLHFSFPS